MKTLLYILLCTGTFAIAQDVQEQELATIRSLYNAGQYEEVLERAARAVRVINFTEAQRVRLLQFSALAAFSGGDLELAKEQFTQLLHLNPDYVLDPFTVPPPAIRLFEKIKKDNEPALELVRQRIALRMEQERKLRAERAEQLKQEEKRRRHVERLTQTVTVRTMKSQYLLLNFVPFGAGQFQQGRTVWGLAFAISEAIMAGLNLVSFVVLDSLLESVTYTWSDRLTADRSGVFKATVRRIPEAQQEHAKTWRSIKLSTGISFYALWALGIFDALWHHKPVMITETTQPLDPSAQRNPPSHPEVRLRIFPTASGLGAGVQVGF